METTIVYWGSRMNSFQLSGFRSLGLTLVKSKMPAFAMYHLRRLFGLSSAYVGHHNWRKAQVFTTYYLEGCLANY